jgi:hypothetical protein
MRWMQSTLVAVAGLFLLTHTSLAQVARVTAAQRTTEKSASGADWQDAGVGADLSSSDRFRTGKRSKADLKFRDGSLVRLGQLSYLEMRGAKQMSLVRGQLLFVALRPGRVLAGAAAAAIKGSVAVVQYKNYKNSEGKDTEVAEFYLYSGLMDIVTALRTVSLKPGQMATVYPDGTIIVGVAPPLQYFGGELHPNILGKPNNNPFAGSKEHTGWRDDDERIERDHDYPILFNPDGFDNLQDGTFPQPTPTPPPVIGDGEGEGPITPRFDLRAASTPALFAASSPAPSASGSTSDGIGGNSFEGTARIEFPQEVRLAALEGESPVAQSTLQVAEDAALVGSEKEGQFDLEAKPAYQHLGESNFDKGRQIGGDAALIGAGASNSAYAYGARLHGFYSNDNWFLDAAYTPLGVHARFEEDRKRSRSLSAISDLSLTYTAGFGEVRLGRQRFLSGPTQATLYGSLIRAGGREIMDAVRFAPDIGDDKSLEVAYLYDAFPRNLPYRISGAQNGFYGRFAIYESFGNFGINVLKYSDADVDDTTGATFDFALPIIRNKMEFYGEIGRDPFRRNLRTFGLTFPWLYEKTGWDVFLETAHLSDARHAEAPPTEYAMRAYKKLSQSVNMVAAVSHFSGSSTKFIVGFSIGARTAR